jgi:hypothetical protein
MNKFRWAARRVLIALGALIALTIPLLIDVAATINMKPPAVEASLRHAGECLIFLTQAGEKSWLWLAITVLMTAGQLHAFKFFLESRRSPLCIRMKRSALL